MDEFVFKKHDSLGSPAAEHDEAFLNECFVDTGDSSFLLDCKDPKSIIIGRTGAGKTALIYKVSNSCEHVINLSPHDLSLNFIASNKVVAFFEEAGVNLTPFYVLLWKHLLVVELLKEKFHIVNERAHTDFMRNIKQILHKKDRYKDLALEYLENWGDKFWLTTEQRIQELTEKVEKSLSGSIGAEFSDIQLSAEGARKLTTEQKRQVVDHGLDAVSRVQIRELDNMLTILEENVFDDSHNPYFLTVDMLDEDWADNRIKFKLIRALIDVVRRFRALTNVKVILALRQDLLHKVIYLETMPGFQEEKYKPLYLKLSWSKDELISIVEARLNILIKRRYTRREIAFKDIFPSNIDGVSTLDYMLDRTFLRPRDIIVFFNECLDLANGRTNISVTLVKEAEANYSSERLKSLANEWATIQPNLANTSRIFYGMKSHFAVSDLTEELISQRFDEIAQEISSLEEDPITNSLKNLYDSSGNFTSIRNFILREFYMTGLIGIKTGPNEHVKWSHLGSNYGISAGEVRPSSFVYIHPMFYRVLGVHTQSH